uniref:Uncharacterized protein n=1 Tax=Anguilla anguilla TaxID=7936 RepID=A0A0E9TC55_ANGAN
MRHIRGTCSISVFQTISFLLLFRVLIRIQCISKLMRKTIR